MQGLTVAASGNDSGELLAAAAACFAIRASGRTPSAFAPVTIGPDAVRALALVGAATDAEPDAIAPHRLEAAAAPSVAAKLAGVALDPAVLLDRLRAAAAGDVLVTALAGGLLAPLTPRYSVRDLARDLGAPVVVVTVARPGLANEALTTIAAARGGALHVAGVVLTGWSDDPGRVVLEERSALAELAGVPVVTLPDAARDSESLHEAGVRWPIDDWLEPTPDAHAADAIEQRREVVLDPYTAWEPGDAVLGDPRSTPRPRIMEALEQIVAAEGPMTATRAYALYNRASGGRKLTSAARAPLSSALYWLAREGKVTLVREADVPWQGDDVARMPDHPEVRVRELGPRELIEVPLDEIAELMRRLRAAQGVADETGLKRAVLSAYGLVRLTARADEYLGLALDLAGEPASAP
jgi:dethiobiotin synthetase